MNITTQPVSFLPTSAAQPTDALRRDNAAREVVAPLKANEAFHRERGLGSDADRRTPGQDRSYAQQLAQARIEAGFPYFIKQVQRQPSGEGETRQSQQAAPQSAQRDSAAPDNELQQVLERSRVQRDDEPLPARFESFAELSQEWTPLSTSEAERLWSEAAGSQSPTTLTYRDSEGRFDTSFSMNSQGSMVDPLYVERGQRIEQFYQGSFRPVEHFLLGVA